MYRFCILSNKTDLNWETLFYYKNIIIKTLKPSCLLTDAHAYIIATNFVTWLKINSCLGHAQWNFYHGSQ